jgi:hypothetical protein
MTLRIAADGVLVLHFAFILFVIGGAGLAFRFPRIVWLHVPAACWGAWVEIAGRICPLTTLENALRVRAGQQGYMDSFVEHYLLPVIYPSGLTRTVQLELATMVIAVNVALYAWLLHRRRKTRIK